MWLTAVMTSQGKDEKAPPRLLIRGMAFSDEVNNQAVTEYVSKLKGQGYFTDDMQIKRIRPVEGTDYAVEFTVDAAVREKLPELPTKPAGKPAEPSSKSDKSAKGNS